MGANFLDYICSFSIGSVSLENTADTPGLKNPSEKAFLAFMFFKQIVVVQSLRPWTAALQASLSFTISWSLLKGIFIESVMPSNHLVLCHPLHLLLLVFPSIRIFSNESALCLRWPKYWSFSFSISPSNEHSGLISFRMDWFDLLTVQGTLKSLLQHHSSKASILRHSAGELWSN